MLPYTPLARHSQAAAAARQAAHLRAARRCSPATTAGWLPQNQSKERQRQPTLPRLRWATSLPPSEASTALMKASAAAKYRSHQAQGCCCRRSARQQLRRTQRVRSAASTAGRQPRRAAADANLQGGAQQAATRYGVITAPDHSMPQHANRPIKPQSQHACMGVHLTQRTPVPVPRPPAAGKARESWGHAGRPSWAIAQSGGRPPQPSPRSGRRSGIAGARQQVYQETSLHRLAAGMQVEHGEQPGRRKAEGAQPTGCNWPRGAKPR